MIDVNNGPDSQEPQVRHAEDEAPAAADAGTYGDLSRQANALSARKPEHSWQALNRKAKRMLPANPRERQPPPERCKLPGRVTQYPDGTGKGAGKHIASSQGSSPQDTAALR